jgi:hypothetical protein
MLRGPFGTAREPCRLSDDARVARVEWTFSGPCQVAHGRDERGLIAGTGFVEHRLCLPPIASAVACRESSLGGPKSAGHQAPRAQGAC